MTFLAARTLLGIKNQWWLLGLILIAAIAFTVITVADNRDERMVEVARDGGGNAAVIEGDLYR